MLAAGLVELTRRMGASSAHVTFLPEADAALLGEMGFLRRTDQQFHLTDEGYGDFEGFLAALASRKRKAVRKERREALAGGIEIEWLTGRDRDGGGVGRLLRLLHGHRLAQMGPALSQPPLLLAARRAHGGPRAPHHGASATAATSPAR